MKPIFVDNFTAKDPEYNNIRDGTDERLRAAKKLTQELWAIYHPYADKHFLIEIRKDFHARFWEMYLACTLMHSGYKLSPHIDKGPDIRIAHKSKIIWIEAVAPTGGNPAKPDSIRDPNCSSKVIVTQDVPDRQIILRYRAVIHDKYLKYYEHINSGLISNDDCYVIAVNGHRVPWAINDLGLPRIVSSVLPFGWPRVTIDKNSLRTVDRGWEYRPYLKKESGELVDTDIFIKPEYNHISAVISSMDNAVNPTTTMGNNFIIVHNPLALRPLPDDFLKIGWEYRAEVSEKEIALSSKNWEKV